jgi:hypothetical protein
MRYYDRIQETQWSDLAVVMGPNVRWTEDDYEDLQRYAPEVLLGLRVLLCTPADALRKTRGRLIHRVILLDGLDFDPHTNRAVDDVTFGARTRFPEARIEWYHVHRSENPPVLRLAW